MLASGTALPETTIADILFAPTDDRVVVALDRGLSRDPLAAEVLMDVAARAPDAESLEQGVQQLAEALDWQVDVEGLGSLVIVTVGRAEG